MRSPGSRCEEIIALIDAVIDACLEEVGSSDAGASCRIGLVPEPVAGRPAHTAASAHPPA
jgi:hypothetical protein